MLHPLTTLLSWVTNRDRLIIAAFLLMLLAMLGIVPGPVAKGIEKLTNDHLRMSDILKVQCVHDAKDRIEQEECVTGELHDGRH